MTESTAAKRKANERAKRAKFAMDIRVGEETVRLSRPSISDEAMCYAQTKQPWEAWVAIASTGVGCLALWWLARRQAGETRLSYAEAAQDWAALAEEADSEWIPGVDFEATPVEDVTAEEEPHPEA